MTGLCSYLVLLVLAQIKISKCTPVLITGGKRIETVEGEGEANRVREYQEYSGFNDRLESTDHSPRQAVPLCP